LIFASLTAYILHLPVETIGSRFGGIHSSLPSFEWPQFTLEKMLLLLPTAFTFALLGGIESLLSALIADSMGGGRHRSKCELVA
jgi:SulP family sulfate permease